jgi:hypothetical protein
MRSLIRPSKFRIALCLSLFLLFLLPFSVNADVSSVTLDSATFFASSGVAIGKYASSTSVDVYIDPSNTNWMAISNSNNLITAGIGSYSGGYSIPYGSPGNTHPQINQSGMDDYIVLNVLAPDDIHSAQATLDNNDALNYRVGNQAVFFGTYQYVRAVNGAYPLYVDNFAETGTLASFFNTYGAGTYTFTLDYYNAFTDAAAHNAEYLLMDTNPAPTGVPEPTTMLLLGLGLIWSAGVRRKFEN